MKLEAINRIEGVNVLAGKGQGTITAYPGDVFEVKDAKEAKRLIDKDAAQEYVVQDKLADSKKTAAQKPVTTRKAAGKKGSTADQKAEDGSDTASDEDLGLGG